MKVFRKQYTVFILDGKLVDKGTPGAVSETRESTKWYGGIKDTTTGKWKHVPLFTDKKASESKLAEMVKARERGEAGLVDPHAPTKVMSIVKALELYLDDLTQQGRTNRYRRQQENQMHKVTRESGIGTIGQLTADALDRYLLNLTCSARSKNCYRQTCIGLMNFLCKKRRLPFNPLLITTRAVGDKKRKRRALPVDQLQKLLDAARFRPLHEAQTVRRGKNKGQRLANVKPEQQASLERQGRHRALLYLTALHTGLRAGELASLRVNDLHLTDTPAWWELDGTRTKNKQDAKAPMHDDLAAELRAWIADTGKQPTDNVFDVAPYSNLCKLLRKDLKKAGIPYRDEKGRYFDFHALRKCTGTYLRKAGIDPSVSQRWMRHSDVRLTMETYNDELMHDLQQCVDAMPKLNMQ